MTQQTILPYQENVLQRFEQIFKSGRLAHAYLFVGPPDAGKRETALTIAKLVNCLNPGEKLFCDECSGCLKINHGSHPDIHLVTSDDSGTIKIEQIRDLNYEIQLKSFEAKRKVFIIEDCENLTLEAANALLKTLEEPAQNSLLILTTSVLEKNLDTIRSRCQVISFLPFTSIELEKKLVAQYQFPPATAHFLAYYCEGCLGKAQTLYDQKVHEWKNEVIDQLILTRDNEAYFKRILSDKENFKEALHVVLTWFRDLTLIKLGALDESLIHSDRIKDLGQNSVKFSFAQLSDIIGEIVSTKKMLDDNLNIKIGLTLLQEKIWRKPSK